MLTVFEAAHASVQQATTAELRRRGVVIDDDHVYTRLRDDAAALRAAAERHDATDGAGLEEIDSDLDEADA